MAALNSNAFRELSRWKREMRAEINRKSALKSRI
jgi:hypothetical protein